jgi:2-polyprenyl-6-methoxyphenol hydroxylase-like FAD-dependent oxidoreductase
VRYDAIIIGGGLAGATLAKALAEAGRSVLVLERETSFRDRVRGEQMHPWGIVEARRLGIYELLKQTCACEVRLLEVRVTGARPRPARDLLETAPHDAGSLHFRHPEMQRVLLGAAARAGAEVVTGASSMVLGEAGSGRSLSYAADGGARQRVAARLIVAADGRHSSFRSLGGFTVHSDPERLVTAGLLIKGMGGPTDRFTVFQNLRAGRAASIIPLGDGYARAYICFRKRWGDPERPLSGDRAVPEFKAMGLSAGIPEAWFENAEPAGPLASFEGADKWVEHPHRDGVVLLGDAAAANDPCYGSGLSMAVRGARMLRDHLLASDDWREAADAYAAEQTADAAALRRITGWLTDLLFEPGPDADARRATAFSKFTEDPGRMLDFVGLGPDGPSDERARQRLFGEI